MVPYAEGGGGQAPVGLKAVGCENPVELQASPQSDLRPCGSGLCDRAVRLGNELIDGEVSMMGEITSRERLGGLLRCYDLTA